MYSAENLDYHLSIVQRNHQRRSQKEELQIRKDAAIEDAKRKAKDLHDKKIQKEEAVAKAKAEAELKVFVFSVIVIINKVIRKTE